MNKQINKIYFRPPKSMPKSLFIQPNDIASIAFVSNAAMSININGTIIQMARNEMICAIVMESVITGHNFSAKDAYSALAIINPAISPIIVANCFTNPFVIPTKAPMQIMTMSMISIVVIWGLKMKR